MGESGVIDCNASFSYTDSGVGLRPGRTVHLGFVPTQTLQVPLMSNGPVPGTGTSIKKGRTARSHAPLYGGAYQHSGA